jgi:hypothetical protein
LRRIDRARGQAAARTGPCVRVQAQPHLRCRALATEVDVETVDRAGRADGQAERPRSACGAAVAAVADGVRAGQASRRRRLRADDGECKGAQQRNAGFGEYATTERLVATRHGGLPMSGACPSPFEQWPLSETVPIPLGVQGPIPRAGPYPRPGVLQTRQSRAPWWLTPRRRASPHFDPPRIR